MMHLLGKWWNSVLKCLSVTVNNQAFSLFVGWSGKRQIAQPDAALHWAGTPEKWNKDLEEQNNCGWIKEQGEGQQLCLQGPK